MSPLLIVFFGALFVALMIFLGSRPKSRRRTADNRGFGAAFYADSTRMGNSGAAILFVDSSPTPVHHGSPTPVDCGGHAGGFDAGSCGGHH